MSGKAREALKSEAARRRIEQMLAAGMSASKIAKLTGMGYAHVRNLAEQLKSATPGGVQ